MSQQTNGDGTGEEDDDQGVAAVYPSSGPNREDMVASYLPDDDDWQSKTVIDVNDPAAIAALKQFGTMFPEVDDLQPVIDEFLDDFLRTKTSVKGAAREEYRDIFMSMYGSGPDDGDGSVAMQLVAADDED